MKLSGGFSFEGTHLGHTPGSALMSWYVLVPLLETSESPGIYGMLDMEPRTAVCNTITLPALTIALAPVVAFYLNM